MRRLSFQIYLSVVGILLLFAVLVSVVWVVHPETPWERDAVGAGSPAGAPEAHGG